MRVRVGQLIDEPLQEVYYLNASPRGGTEVCRLPIVRADLAAPLADELDAIIACSDLQGMARGIDGRAELLGVELAAVLEELAFDGVTPSAARTGVILAGDLYSVPQANKRGGHGDVADVWVAFAERFAWVAGVAGNHDDVTEVKKLGDKVHLLDGELTELDGLRIAGIGGIIGNPRKPGRRAEEDQLAHLKRLLAREPDVVVLHEGPCGDANQPGHDRIRELVEDAHGALTICGHVHWKIALADHIGGQILNVDTRAVVLVAPA